MKIFSWKSLGNSSEMHFIMIGNSRFKVPKTEYDFVYRNNKEPFVLPWLDSNLKNGYNFLDIGANVGEYSLYASKIGDFENTRIFAIEPRKKTRNYLKKILDINGIKNIFVLPFAISNTDNDVIFRESNVDNPFFGKSKIEKSDLSIGKTFKDIRLKKSKKKIRTKMKARKIDSLIKEGTLPVPQLVKIDVEGHEVQVLEGMINTLKIKQLKHILLECSFENIHEVNRILVSQGFSLIYVYREATVSRPGYFSFERSDLT